MLSKKVVFQDRPVRLTVESVRRSLRRLFLQSVRLYTANTPVRRGRHRAYMLALSFLRELPENLPVRLPDGRRFIVNLATGMQSNVYFVGEYETALTFFAERLIKDGDTCIDVGANFGWYTSLFHKLCGNAGGVHSFEPMPPTFRELILNMKEHGSPRNVHLNNIALGAERGSLRINLFKGLSTGHASLSDQGRNDAVAFECRVETLDDYLIANRVPEVAFVKVDIEGAEMMFLNGADSLFSQQVPPILLMEMALQQTSNFGYFPDDLLKFISGKAEYRFFKIDEVRSRLIEIFGFEADDIGANVLCITRGDPRFTAIADFVDQPAGNR